jgi:hypothetical protein
VKRPEKVHVDILAPAVDVRKIAENANLLVDVESREQVPTI